MIARGVGWPLGYNAAMPHKPRKSRGALVVLLGVPLLLAFYVLSVGPAAWMHLSDPDNQGLANAWGLYAPVVVVATQWQPTKQALEWYVNLWVPDGTIIIFHDA